MHNNKCQLYNNRSIRFTVLIPTYNQEMLVRATIDSVLAQDFPAKQTEIIVVDDGSTDRTREVLASYGSRIKALYQPNQGPEAARHFGVSIATGDYFVLLDHDDLLFPWALSLYDHIIRSLNAPPLILGQMIWFRDGEPVLERPPESDSIEVYKYADYLAREIPIPMTCSRTVIKRSVVARTGVLRPKATAFPFDIADMLLLLGECSPCVVVRQPYSVAYRMHASNTVTRTDYMVRRLPCLIQLERAGSYPGGTVRRFERQACIGGLGWTWARNTFKRRKLGLFTWLIWQCGPMMVIAVLRKFRQRLTPKTPAITLGKLRSATLAGTELA
jgi:glycosyltransferase involved in cell wall biosynthesis